MPDQSSSSGENEVKTEEVQKRNKDGKRTGDYNGEHRTNAFLYCMMLGFFAGLFWGLTRWMLHLFHFTKVNPAFMADPFFLQSFLKTGWGQLVGLGCFIVFSMAAAMIYKLILGRIRGPWAGLCYGLLWWGILFAWAGPWLLVTPPFMKLGVDSMVSELSVFLLWGLFIGYTIAFEFTDEASREPSNATGKLSKMGS
ncbi:YqhR family membrane protein [Paenibacillus sepulcri]|uniref:Membrane protein YqhR n=1 Tax=Paenibacillus sepulcri TaxID=359917 RepID=A0ABS7BYT8_9BACL|nr:hypothetical protein [Paenibacillus sepulcri]